MTESRVTPGLAEDEVPMTPALLSFLHMMQSAKEMFLSERMVTEALDLPDPGDYASRFETLFYTTHAAMADKLGLKRNAITKEAIMWLELDPELGRMSRAELQEFVFNPWAYQGRGGIYRKKQ